MKRNFSPGTKHFLNIESISDRGDGVGRINGWVIFIPYAVPGDYLEIEIVDTKKNYSLAVISEIITPSLYRISPFCKYFGKCGGCSLQTVNYDYQLKMKSQLLKEVMKRIGKVEVDNLKDFLPSPETRNYRNKVQYVACNNKERIFTGFFYRGTHEIIGIDYCPVQYEITNEVAKKVSSLLLEMKWSVYNEKLHKGLIRYIIIKASYTGKELLCILVTTRKNLPFKQKFIDSISKIIGLCGIVQNVNALKGNSILGEKNFLLWGRNYIIDEIEGIKFKISSSSFFQVNRWQLKNIYGIISEIIKNIDLKFVIDAYCGIGTFSLFLSGRAGRILGIEENNEAIEMAKDNAALNNMNNLTFLAGKVEDLLYETSEDKKVDLIILDPPRKGCDKKVLQSLIKIKARNLIYISCKPSTLARDLAVLKEGGYKIELIQPVDMFPHTHHIECICYLKTEEN